MTTKLPCGKGFLNPSLLCRALLLGFPLVCISTLGGHAQIYSVLHHFDGGAGGKSVWSGLVTSGTALYGTTEEGGNHGLGTVFKLNLDGSDFAVLRHLSKADGTHPMGDLLLSGTTLFGTASQEGMNGGGGSLFRMNLDGSDFVVLKDFGGADGSGPRGGVAISGDTLFGSTHDGGARQPYGLGTVYRIKTDGTGFAVLHSYGSADGNNPCGTLVVSGTTLYGTTDDWSGGIGTVFKLKTDGTGYTILKHFNRSDGRMPIGSLLLSGTTLYGTTIHGGPYDWGTVFKINTDGTGFASLQSFPWVGMPYGGLTLVGRMLFGTTTGGGPTDQGIIFRINTDGSDYSVMQALSRTNGSGPVAGMILFGNDLYGTTRYGGTSNAGVIFKVSIAPPAITRAPRDSTAEIGSAARLAATTESGAPPFYQWWCNDTQAVSAMTPSRELNLTNVQYSNAGSYTVVVTNIFGSVTSTPALLNVIPAVARRPVPFITLRGEPGNPLHVECADSFWPSPNWAPLDTLVPTTGTATVVDLALPLPPRRFYRAWPAGSASVDPNLSLNVVPAITLGGAPGDNLRLDCIDAVGPIDSWTTLATIAITNASQLYFDTSAPGHRPRLYRVVPVP